MNYEEIMLQQIRELRQTVTTLAEKGTDPFSAENESGKLIQKEYKDRVFKFIFGNPENRQWALSLYNAMNGTDYTDPNAIQFNTIGEVAYMHMRNDVSFIIAFELNLWEHQSKFNPNMPMRFFRYAAALYAKYIATSNYYEYSSSLQPVPRPKCVCFYNGTQEQPEKQVLKLSDAYEGEGDIEVKVTMLNINYGKNKQLMDACSPLREYAWLVDAVRRHQAEMNNLEAAVDAAIDEMPDDFMIKQFLIGNRAEVKAMFFIEYDEKRAKEQERQEGRDERSVDVATNMIKEGGVSASFISKVCLLPEDTVRNLAKSLNIAIQ